MQNRQIRGTEAKKMQKFEMYDGDGKTRDERETCIPKFTPKDKMKGAGTR